MKQIVAIIGNANIENDIEKQEISFELGKLIIDNGFVLATGGLGGVMEYASKGAKISEKYTENSIIGVLPDYNSDNANKIYRHSNTNRLWVSKKFNANKYGKCCNCSW